MCKYCMYPNAAIHLVYTTHTNFLLFTDASGKNANLQIKGTVHPEIKHLYLC